MAKKKQQAAQASSKTQEKPESSLTRRDIMKSLTAGTLALGITGSAQEVLAKEGATICGTPQNTRRFVEAMLDTKLRAEIERNPARVMARFGIQVPAGMVPKTVKLPPEEEVSKLLKAIDSRQGEVVVRVAFFPAFLAFFAFFAFRSA